MRHWFVAALLGLVVFVAVGCNGSAPSHVPPATVEDDNTLGQGDVFDVRVYGETELSGTYRVAQDGSIDFPLIGRIPVEGLEPTAIADLIEERLRSREILRNPDVSIFLREFNSKRISIMGAVARPGTFPVATGLTVVQAISLAGGFTPIASRDGTVVTRRIDGRLQRFRVPVDDVTQGRAQDFPLRAGDLIFVPERLF